jgi:hypothetical protein
MPSVPPQRAPAPDADREASPTGSPFLRFGTALGAGVLAAMVVAIPATTRTLAAAPDVSTLRAWGGLAAAALGPAVLAVLVLRSTRVGLRAFTGPHVGLRVLGVLLWLLLLFELLARFGAVLHATTHHHALAGVTYALVAVAIAIGLAVLCARLVSIIGARSDGTRRLLGLGLGAIVVAGIVLVAVRFARTFGGTPVAGTIVDLFAFGIATVFASRLAFAEKRVLALVGPPICGILLFAGVSSLRGSASLDDAIARRAPAFALVASPLAGR